MNRYEDLERKLSSSLLALESILQEKLDNFGIYYRMFARIKTGFSIQNKLHSERYSNNPDRKISDLFGIRITLYYQDDIEVCKKIFEDMFINVRWKESESDASTFDATKNNGTFVLPGFVQQIVLPELEGLRIEPTFEIQIRTVFFEGWHEAEHDMRYKEMALWDDLPKESRKLNSILATLEMCDQYMVTLFDDVGHDFYKDEKWGQMIRFKYRLKTLNGELDPEMEKRITPDLAKRVFKWNKKEFIEIVLQNGINRLDADTIVYLVNESLKDEAEYVPQISEIYQVIRRKNIKARETYFEKNIVQLQNEKAFEIDVTLHIADDNKEECFVKAINLIYESWLKKELGELYPDAFEASVHPIKIKKQGFSCKFKYDLMHFRMTAVLTHIGIDAPGKMWSVSLQLYENKQGDIQFHCLNEFARPEKAATEVLPYSRPKVYYEMGRQIGLCDVRPLESDIVNFETMSKKEFVSFLENPSRKLPVILISVPDEENRLSMESCYGRLVDYTNNAKLPQQNNLMRKVGFVCHVFYALGGQADWVANWLGENAPDFQNGIRFFKAGFTLRKKTQTYKAFDEKMILEMPKDIYALRTKPPYFYQSVSGPDAVRHEMIQMVYHHILVGK